MFSVYATLRVLLFFTAVNKRSSTKVFDKV